MLNYRIKDTALEARIPPTFRACAKAARRVSAPHPVISLR
jgi:hypothetical protein